MVIRKVVEEPKFAFRTKAAREQREALGAGIILSKQMSGNPEHPCIEVYYTKVGKAYLIAESLMEIVSEVGS